MECYKSICGWMKLLQECEWMIGVGERRRKGPVWRKIVEGRLTEGRKLESLGPTTLSTVTTPPVR